jgi:hypothetical protein
MALARGEERLFRVGLYVLLRAATVADLDARERQARETLDMLVSLLLTTVYGVPVASWF